MTNALSNQIDSLAKAFAAAVVAALRQSNLADILEQGDAPVRNSRGAGRRKGSKNGTVRIGSPVKRGRGRPKTVPIQAAVALIVNYVKSHPGALSTEIQAALGLQKNVWSWCVRKALEAKQVRREGKVRGTRYWPR
jgi:hypothetical protein